MELKWPFICAPAERTSLESGVRVLVTRPESQAQGWVGDLRQRGFEAEALPLIAIAPAAADILQTRWQELQRFRAVMFVSANAVHHFFGQIPTEASWPSLTRAWAPGAGTAEALLRQGLDSRWIDTPPAVGQFDSEALWRQVANQVKPGDRILIVRGGDGSDSNHVTADVADGAGNAGSGRDWLAHQLKAAGAQVEMVAIYQRQLPQWSQQQFAQAEQAGGGDSVWIFSSALAVSNLQILLPGHDWTHTHAIATHPRIAQAVRAAGFIGVCEAKPTLDAIVAALKLFQ